MEVVPTGDGDEDDGVIWFRCPQCQGFLPKLSGADLQNEQGEAPTGAATDAGDPDPGAEAEPAAEAVEDLPWDSPADMMAAHRAAAGVGEEHDAEALPAADDPRDDVLPPPGLAETPSELGDDFAGTTGGGDADEESPPPSEPVHEYAAMLAELDASSATPYRPWGSYEVGECVHHLAWDDCGVVVAKEALPGGRKVVKCYFEDAGVVRLIEQAPR